MGRPPEGEAEIIGDVHQRADRLLPRRLQPVLHPFGRWAIRHPAHHAAIKGRAACWIVRADFHRAGIFARNPVIAQRFQRAEPRRRQIAGNAIDAHAIGPVGGDRHIEHRAGAVIGRKWRADRRIFGQFDDALHDPRPVPARGWSTSCRCSRPREWRFSSAPCHWRAPPRRECRARRPAPRGHWARRRPPAAACRSHYRHVSTCSLSASGCGAALSTRATAKPASRSAGSSTPSTSMPMAFSVAAIRATSASVSRK